MRLNKASMTGFTFCFMAILFGVATNGGIKTIPNYLHIPSLIVTMGGAVFATMITADSFEDFVIGVKGLSNALTRSMTNVSEITNTIYTLSDVARKEGLLALEEQAEQLTDPFLKKGISLVIDGSNPDLTKDILESEMNHRQENAKKQIHFWQDLGSYAPAWGMVGTLIGLVNMMKSMGDNPAAIGEGMSLALITTLYGSIIANWICIPIARRLEKKSEAEYLAQEIVIEGVLSIQAGENPYIIKEKIKAILLDDNSKNEELAA